MSYIMYTPDSDGSMIENVSECLGRCDDTYDQCMSIVETYKGNFVFVALFTVCR